jgi:hypothetical protein
MTEIDWLACREPKPMLEFLHQPSNKVSVRKRRLFACACCRLLDDVLLDREIRKALDAAERYADGLIVDSTLMNWYHRACASRNQLRGTASKQWSAYHAVTSAAVSSQYGAWQHAYETVANALAHGSGHRPGDPEWRPARLQALQAMVPLLHDVFGNPFHQVTIDPAWLAWNEGVVFRLAQGFYQDRAEDRLPILGDALEEAGCADQAILSHLRHPGPHVRGCWVVDFLLGRN